MKKIISSIISFFDISLSFTEEQRRQKLLDILLGLFGFLIVLVLVACLIMWPIRAEKDTQDLLFVLGFCFCSLPILYGLFVLNHSKAHKLAPWLFISLLFLSNLFETPDQLAGGRGLANFAPTIIAAGILIWPSASFILAIISSIVIGIAALIAPSKPIPIPAIGIFFLLATMVWMATHYLEDQVRQLRKTNIALKENEERYRTLVEISPDMVVLTDLYGEIIVVNQAGLTLFGFTDQDEVKGRKIFDFIAEDDRQRAITEFSAMADIQSAVRVEYTAQTLQGTNFYIEISASVLRDSKGYPQAVLSVGRDVTLRKKMEQALLAEKDEAYRALVNNSAQGLVLLQNGQIILANAAIANCLGLTIEEMRGMAPNQIFDLVHPDDREIGYTRMQERLQGKSVPASYETRIVQKDGTIRWLELRPTVITLDGMPASQITAIDITERKNAEDALRTAHDRLNAILNTLPDFLFELDREQRFCDFRAMKSASFSPVHEIFLGKTVREALPADAASIMSAALDDAIIHGQHSGATYDIEMPDGKYSFELAISTLGDIKSPAGRFIMLVRDITERKRASEALKEREKRYRDLFENASLAVFQSGLDGKIIAVNPEFARMFGYQSPDEVKELIKDAAYTFADPQRRAEIIRLRTENPALSVFENIYRRKDGSTFIGQLTIKSIMSDSGQVQCFEGFIEDITLRKETERALRESEERYRGLAEAAHDIIVIVTPDARVEYVNKFAAQLVGMAPEEIIGLPHSQFFQSDTNLRHQGNLQKVFERGFPMFTESRTLFPKGEIWLSNWLVPLKDETGATKRILAISRDITNYKRMEAALKESEERYRNLAEAAQDMIFILGPDDRIQYMNRFAAQVVDITPESAIGMPRSRLFPSKASERQYENIQQVFKKGQPVFAENFTPFPTGGRWLSTWLVPLKDESGEIKALLGISRDISKRKELEESLIEAKNSLEQRVLERTADLNNSREQLRLLTRETVLAQENERRRLSRELHDEAGQGLIGLTFSLDEILAEIPEEMNDIREKISRTLTRIDKLNQHIRGMAHGLRPPILDVAGINLALQGFCRDFSTEAHFPVIYSGANDLPALSEEISITLYRIVQEAITNIIKHSHATEAHVSLNHDADCITLIIRDNGVGFDTMKTPKGVGLAGMEERLGLLGGQLEIASRRKHGTRLKAIVPITKEVPNP